MTGIIGNDDDIYDITPDAPPPPESPDAIQESIQTPLKKLKLSLEAEVLPLPKITKPAIFEKEKVVHFISETKRLDDRYRIWLKEVREEFKLFDEKLKNEGKFDDNEFIHLIKSLIGPFYAEILNEIKHLDIKDANVFFELIKAAASHGVKGIGSNIREFNFNREQRFEIAKQLARVLRDNFNYNLDFDLDDHQLMELVTINPLCIARKFDELKYNQAKRFEIATVAAQKWGGIIFNADLRLTPDQMFEIAKIAAQSDTQTYQHYMPILRCPFNEEQRFEIANLVAQKASVNLDDFHLSNPEHLFRVAESMLKNKSAYLFSAHPSWRKIKNPDHLFELAKLAAKKDPYFSECFKNFKITDPEKRFELAKIAASNYPAQLSQHLLNYGAFDQNRLIELANLVIKKDPKAFSEYVKNFKIEDLNVRFEMAKICAKFDGNHLSLNVKDFEINDPEMLYDLVKIVVRGDAACIRSFFNETPLDVNLQRALNLTRLEEKINSWDNATLKKEVSHLLNAFVQLCKINPDQEGLISFLQQHNELLPTIFEERDPQLYWPFFCGILRQDLITQPIANTTTKQMIQILLTNVDLNNNDNESVYRKMIQCDFRDTHMRTPIIYLFDELMNEKNLTPTDQKRILDWVFEDPKNKDQVINRCLVVRAIPNIDGKLNVELNKPEFVSLEKSLLQLFLKFLPELKADNLENQLQKTFFKMRNPMSILIYTGRLASSRSRKQKLNLLTRFMNSVLDGTFKQVRQDVDTNEHLKFLQVNHSSVLEKYHEGIAPKQVDLKDVMVEQEAPNEALRKSIKDAITHGHIKDTDFPKISYIPNDEQNFARLRKDANLDELEAEIKKLSKEKMLHKKDSKRFQELDSHVTYLKLQKSLIKLMEKNVTEANFNECKSLFTNALKKDAEFLNDLKAMASTFVKSKEINTVILSDTDDPYEILSCGSEVDGSCQRLDGRAELNQGLLGYLLNGQTRLITCKVPENDSIKGRVIIRLLIDENKKPVLQMEGFYPKNLSPKLKQAILNFALEKAKALNVPLVSKEVEANEMKPFKGMVENLGTQAPEYIDSAEGIEDDNYELANLKEIMR